jgi:hypothetical protein
VARPHLTRRESDHIYIAIGVGDMFAAIDGLITAIARERTPLSDDLVATVTAWLDCYVGQDAEPPSASTHRRGENLSAPTGVGGRPAAQLLARRSRVRPSSDAGLVTAEHRYVVAAVCVGLQGKPCSSAGAAFDPDRLQAEGKMGIRGRSLSPGLCTARYGWLPHQVVERPGASNLRRMWH